MQQKNLLLKFPLEYKLSPPLPKEMPVGTL